MLNIRIASLGILAAMVLAAPIVLAQDKPAVTGTWKWSQQGRQGGNPVEWTMKLKQEGDKVTGMVIGTFGGNPTETAISDATIKDGELKFNVVREGQDGTKRITSYTGKLDGDTIKGSIERERQGEKVKTDWEAKRVKDPA